MTDIKANEKRIDGKTFIGAKTGIIHSIKYPCFESDNNEHKALVRKMNAFYEKTARKYASYGEKILSRQLKRMEKKGSLPICLGMKCTVSTAKESVVSVVLDLSCSRGKGIRMRRFTQMWSMDEGTMITAGTLLNLTAKNKRYILELVLEQAKKQGLNGEKEFYHNVVSLVKKHFCFNNCFASPSAVVFFFDAGTLRPLKYGACCFAIPYEKLEGVVNFKAEDKERSDKGQIVNNI